MEIQEIINKLSNELETEVKSGNYAAIHEYIQIALVIGLEQPLITNNKEIQMLDDNGNLIKTFYRPIDAAYYIKRKNNIKTNKQKVYIEIWKSLNNKKNKSYGYHWKYKQKLTNNEQLQKTNKSHIE